MLEELQLSPDQEKFLRLPTTNFPFADYAMSNAEGLLQLVDAKTGRNRRSRA
jgi:hypothetical protein